MPAATGRLADAISYRQRDNFDVNARVLLWRSKIASLRLLSHCDGSCIMRNSPMDRRSPAAAQRHTCRCSGLSCLEEYYDMQSGPEPRHHQRRRGVGRVLLNTILRYMHC